jgi:hypothetical protein
MTVLEAAYALRRYPIFRKTSLQHLTDLVEQTLPEQKVIPAGRTVDIPFVFMLVVGGTAHVQPSFALGAGDVFWSALSEAAQHAMLRGGVGRGITGSPLPPIRLAVVDDFGVPVEGTAVRDTLVLPLTIERLRIVGQASISFGRSVDLASLGIRMTLHDLLTHRYDPAYP